MDDDASAEIEGMTVGEHEGERGVDNADCNVDAGIGSHEIEVERGRLHDFPIEPNMGDGHEGAGGRFRDINSSWCDRISPSETPSS